MGVSRYVFVLVLIVGAFSGYLFHPPVPKGLAEPWKYRLVLGVAKITRVLAFVKYQFVGGNQTFIEMYRGMYRKHRPKEIVPGSNIRSEVMSFDGVKVRVYEPIKRKEAEVPAMIFMHGGGLALASIDVYDRLTRRMAEELDIVLVSVEYRLIPEYLFPAQIEDSLTATKYLLTHASDFGVDPRRVGVSGDSAGGYLAAVIAQQIHDMPEFPDIKVQILFYPGTQMYDFSTPSYQKCKAVFGENGMLTQKTLAWLGSMYHFGRADLDFMGKLMANNHTAPSFKQSARYQRNINHSLIPKELVPDFYKPPPNDTGDLALWEKVKEIFSDPRHDPLMRDDLRGMPRTFVATCGFDCIRDDGIMYAKRLEQDGNHVEWVNYAGCFHGILWQGWINFKIGNLMLKDGLEFFKANI
ncbi:neutral cholesterol ester hydrolase 1-like [Diadema setosum]|uniref:neutral cholesterol ester hydrolase 1-like n=1 Tax=Diadema setosum TaxID=31175 RepID=UPI003B3A93A3